MYVPDFSSVLCVSSYCVKYYYAFLLIPVIIPLLYFLIMANWVKFPNKAEQLSYVSEKKKQRKISFVLRSTIAVCLIIAISSPFASVSKKVQGDATLTILIDNSTSFGLFDREVGEKLAKEIKTSLPVRTKYIAYEEHSNIGDGILNNIEGDDNLLVISDGNNNEGRLVGDIAAFASSLNSTISTLDIKPIKADIGVLIEGPTKVIKDNVEEFSIIVNNAGEELSYHIEVDIDGEVVLGKDEKGTKSFKISKKFSGEEYHKLTARLTKVGEKDAFQQNNEFFKSIKVVQRPKVLFVSDKNPALFNSLSEIYDMKKESSIPDELSEYFTVILDDAPMGKISPKADLLNNYVSDGNGLIVIGGKNSYDKGAYKKSIFETLLPVRVGAGEEEEKSDVQIVIIVDVSGTTGVVYNADTGKNEVRDYDKIIRALAISVLESLSSKNNVGVVAVGVPDAPHVGKVTKSIDELKGIKKELIDKISRLKGGGQTAIDQGMWLAYDLLGNSAGSKNIILISDGRGLWNTGKDNVKATAKSLNSKGVKTYVVGVGATGQQDRAFLQGIADIGQGIYWPADASNRLKIVFGEPQGEQKEYLNTLNAVDNNHFITSNLKIDAVLSGYNYILPKPAARLLVTTNKKIPILAVWRFGLGRVVSIGTDDGTAWAGGMLSGDNSKLLTRSINWAVGNPNRKKNFDVDAEDTTIGHDAAINVISSEMPKSDKLEFSKIDTNLYAADLNIENTGFHDVMGAVVAVNYNTEYRSLGMNEEFINVVKSTGGFVFDPTDTDNIIESIRSISKRERLETVYYKWPFVLAALILFLADVSLRRIKEYHIRIR